VPHRKKYKIQAEIVLLPPEWRGISAAMQLPEKPPFPVKREHIPLQMPA
jgi:hypothetical protein